MGRGFELHGFLKNYVYFRNQRVSCSSKSIPTVDLNAWAEESPAVGRTT